MAETRKLLVVSIAQNIYAHIRPDLGPVAELNGWTCLLHELPGAETLGRAALAAHSEKLALLTSTEEHQEVGQAILDALTRGTTPTFRSHAHDTGTSGQ